ncbi:unnamed protein product [Discosporangium mesarthrocarpum]
MQAQLHQYNASLLKMESLLRWSDPSRTRAWMAGVVTLAAVLLIVPSRYIWAAVVLFFFSEPVRPEGKMLLHILWEDLWGGLPEESSTHTNMHMQEIYRKGCHL